MPMYDERDWTSFMYVSDDGGETWTRSAKIFQKGTGMLQPAIVPVDEGRLLAFMRTTAGLVFSATSIDDTGMAWREPSARALPNPNSAVELIRLSSGTLICVYNPTIEGRSPLRVALSDDSGATWPAWRDLETDAGEFSYPTALQTSDGVVHVLYTHRRTAIGHVRVDEGWVRGGA